MQPRFCRSLAATLTTLALALNMGGCGSSAAWQSVRSGPSIPGVGILPSAYELAAPGRVVLQPGMLLRYAMRTSVTAELAGTSKTLPVVTSALDLDIYGHAPDGSLRFSATATYPDQPDMHVKGTWASDGRFNIEGANSSDVAAALRNVVEWTRIFEALRAPGDRTWTTWPFQACPGCLPETVLLSGQAELIGYRLFDGRRVRHIQLVVSLPSPTSFEASNGEQVRMERYEMKVVALNEVKTGLGIWSFSTGSFTISSGGQRSSITLTMESRLTAGSVLR